MEDMDLTVPPRRHEEPVELDVTMPGKRDRKPDGRFDIGDLVMKRYKVLAELGQGGMGVVYKCFDETAGIEVALKALPPELSSDLMAMEDIKDNFQLVAKLVHQNIAICKNLEKDNSNGNYYLIMECCEGEDLRRWIRRRRREGKLEIGDIIPVIQQIAEALDYAHKQKVIHRDIKPGNIMINADGDIKVLDFGLAAQIHSSMSMITMVYTGTSGTGPYMSPEQWRGRRQGAAADQYALAVMTYEMISGYLPFENSNTAVLREVVLHETPEKIEDISDFAWGAICKAMSKDPVERFASCREFVAALNAKVSAGNYYNNQTSAESKDAKTSVAEINNVSPHYQALSISSNTGFQSGANICKIMDKDVGECFSSCWNWLKGFVQKEPEYIDTETLLLNGIINLSNGVILEMVKVERGSFTMSLCYEGIYMDEIAHTKILTQDFYIGKYEVTNEQWCAVMGVKKAPSRKNKEPKFPVEHVSWHDAMSFCEKMNKYVPAGWRFTLPTETQWEYAARGGNKSRNYKYSGSNDIRAVAWYDGNSGRTTHEVGGKAPNELGLYDMSGNVWEWCLDNWNGKSNNTRAEFTRDYRDQDSSLRVLRGGSWYSSTRDCRSGDRDYRRPVSRDYDIGFRLALVRAD